MEFLRPRTLQDGSLLRPAKAQDIDGILDCIKELAEFEREPAAVENTPELTATALFGDTPAAVAHVVESAGKICGIAVWYLTYSTWTGVQGIHLEDLYVRKDARKRGYGLALISSVAEICVANGYKRLEWQVLDWNTPAIDFYEQLGAIRQSQWLDYRLSGDSLQAVAQTALQ